MLHLHGGSHLDYNHRYKTEVIGGAHWLLLLKTIQMICPGAARVMCGLAGGLVERETDGKTNVLEQHV